MLDKGKDTTTFHAENRLLKKPVRCPVGFLHERLHSEPRRADFGSYGRASVSQPYLRLQFYTQLRVWVSWAACTVLQ